MNATDLGIPQSCEGIPGVELQMSWNICAISWSKWSDTVYANNSNNEQIFKIVPCWGWENKSASLLKCDQFPRLPESGEKELSSLLVGGVHASLGHPNNIV